MSWIKVGPYFLNLDQISSVEINEHKPGQDHEITVFYSSALSEQGRANDIFTGKHADAILQYLESIATDIEHQSAD